MECVHAAGVVVATAAPVGWGVYRWAKAHKPSRSAWDKFWLGTLKVTAFLVAIGMISAGWFLDFTFLGLLGGAFMLCCCVALRLDHPVKSVPTRRLARRNKLGEIA